MCRDSGRETIWARLGKEWRKDGIFYSRVGHDVIVVDSRCICAMDRKCIALIYRVDHISVTYRAYDVESDFCGDV
jgi:hypothetical protein